MFFGFWRNNYISCYTRLPVLVCVVRLLHFISAARVTRVTVPMGTCSGPVVLLGALDGAFTFFQLCSRRFFINGIAGWSWLQLFFAGLPCLSLYLLLDDWFCIFLDWRLLIPCLARVWPGHLLVPSGGAGLWPARAFLLSLAVLWWVWWGQALRIRAVVGSTWQGQGTKGNTDQTTRLGLYCKSCYISLSLFISPPPPLSLSAKPDSSQCQSSA